MPSRSELRRLSPKEHSSDTFLHKDKKKQLREADTFEKIADVLVPVLWQDVRNREDNAPPLTPSLLLEWIRGLEINPYVVVPPSLSDDEDEIDRVAIYLLNEVKPLVDTARKKEMEEWQLDTWKRLHRVLRALDNDTRAHASQPVVFEAVLILMGLRPLPRSTKDEDEHEAENIFTNALMLIHKKWVSLSESQAEFDSPIIPLIRAFIQDQEVTIEPEKRNTRITPTDLNECYNVLDRPERQIGVLAQQGIDADGKMWLPGLAPEPSPIVPALPLEIYNASDRIPPQKGRGASLELRIWINAILSYPFGERTSYDARKLNLTLRDFTEWLYPRGWNRTECLPRIREALHNVHNIRTRWERRIWSIVQVPALPDWDIKLNDSLPLIVQFPDGMAAHGALIDVMKLNFLGSSAPQFRSWIRLAYIWDKAKRANNGSRVYNQRPEALRNDRGKIIDQHGNVLPNNNWNHAKAVWTGGIEDNPAANRVPVLTNVDIVHLAYDNNTELSNSAFKERLRRGKAALLQMEKDGYIVIEKEAVDRKYRKGWRILEPRTSLLRVS